MKKRILCMGAINIDLTMYMHRLPLAGETIVTDNFQTFPGGKGGNQAAAAATLGAVVRYFTKLGDDAFSTQLMEEQKKVGVDTDYIIIEKGQTAGIAMIRVDEGGQNSISFTPGANKLLTPQDVREHPEVFEGCDILLITMEIMPETVYEAIRMASERNMTVIVDPSPVPQGGIPADVIPLIHYAKPTETEAAIFTGKTIASMDDARAAVDQLMEQGFRTPIVSMSKEGAVTKYGGEYRIIPPLKVNSVDSTAAGDIFLGAFAASLADGKDLDACLRFASVAAAISTERKGAQSSIPSYSEVMERL